MAATLVATMRDEAPFILEWVSYHLEIGFAQIVVFSNDCTDGTNAILAALDAEGIITHVDQCVDPDLSVAGQVAQKIQDQNIIPHGNWVIWLDADEFLNIHPGRGHINDLVSALGDARGMCISWRIFGDSDQDIFCGAFLDEQYVRCASFGEVWQNVKTLFRHGPDVEELFQHKPILSSKFWEEGGYFLSSTGQRLQSADKDTLMKSWVEGKKRGKIEAAAAGWDIAQINHYAVRTKPLFERKQKRGRIGEANRNQKQRYNDRYFRELNINKAYDRSILRWADKTRNRAGKLKAMIKKRLDIDALISQHYGPDVVAISASDAGDKISTGAKTAMPLKGDDGPTEKMLAYDEVITSNGIRIPYVPEIISPKLEKQMRRNRYEGGELETLRDLLKPGDRVLELGAGVGLISAAAANTKGVEWVCAVEANPDMIPLIEETHRLNGVHNVTLLNGVVTPHAGDPVDFYLRSDFWSSSMEADSRPFVRSEKVQTIGIDDLVAKHDPTVIICDIEGGELGLFDNLDLANVRSILIELHPRVYGRRSAASLNDLFERNGLHALPVEKRTNVRCFQRRTIPADTKGWPPESPNVLVATCMKDEGPFILEWLAWHKAIGIENFVVYTNDCTDGTDLILDRLQELGEVRHLPNPAVAQGSTFYQPAALAAVQDSPEFKAADYFVSMDVDEFINIRTGSGNLSDLLRATGPFDALSMTELNHGSNGRLAYEPGLLMEQFPKHQTMAPGRWKSARGVKTIVRLGDKLEKIRNHRPDFKSRDLPLWLDGSGRPLGSLAEDTSLNGIDCRGTYNLVVLDHFSLRSLDSFLIKMFRGDVVIDGKRVSQRYWRTRNNDAEAKSGLDHARPAFRAYFDKLMADAKLKALHEDACHNHASRIADLLEQDEYKARKAWILENSWNGPIP